VPGKPTPSCVDKRTGVKIVTPGVTDLSPQTGGARAREPHGMCPASVLLDGEISDKAVRAYGIMALRAFGHSKIALSYAELAAGLHGSERAAMRAAAELVARGHVDVLRTHNYPNAYVLRSTVFQRREAVGATQAGDAGCLPLCAKCRRPCRRLARSGLCRSCTAEADLAARVREVRGELGADASPEQIAERLKQAAEERGRRRLTARVRKAMEAA